ncbi:uncharacterized protein LOC114337234 [Diabrotica virgifera virgifera]|nr:uncharacterized protein LOC114337234 [Diabrotica virgifera virgifera]
MPRLRLRRSIYKRAKKETQLNIELINSSLPSTNTQHCPLNEFVSEQYDSNDGASTSGITSYQNIVPHDYDIMHVDFSNSDLESGSIDLDEISEEGASTDSKNNPVFNKVDQFHLES